MKTTFQWSLTTSARLFQQIKFNVSTRNVAGRVEINSNKFPLKNYLDFLDILTNLEELSFLTVLLLPKASKIGLA